tara:strand:+ start:1855 stop:2739 length:885 start_codon:yes stop_codon:yes gene_type:complete
MKNCLTLLIILLFNTSLNAETLDKVINKVYNKSSEKAETYIKNFLNGPGETEVSISSKNENKPTGTIMIVRPFSINEKDLVFYQAQFNSYHVLGDTRQSLNYGVGKRFLSDDESYFWGLNSFLDLDKEMNSRASLGSELKAANFNITGNYYLDVIGGSQKVGSDTERVLDGYNIEIEGQVPYTPWANISYNSYNWEAIKSSKDSDGDIYATTINLSNDLTLKAGYDDNNISDNMDFIKLTYKFGGIDRPNISDGFSRTAFEGSDVREEMLTKVKRSNIITLEVESTGVVITNGN